MICCKNGLLGLSLLLFPRKEKRQIKQEKKFTRGAEQKGNNDSVLGYRGRLVFVEQQFHTGYQQSGLKLGVGQEWGLLLGGLIIR